MANTYAVIMAGGAGTRFWPASRERRPKQLLPLGGNDESLLAATVRRLQPLVSPDRVYVVTGQRLAEATGRAVPDVPPRHILREPVGRNTAPCIGWAAATIARTDPEALIAVLPSDHYITDEAEFRAVLSRALESAASGRLTTVGVVPTRAETGYGYIELGDEIKGAWSLPGAVRSVARFVEKPDRPTAEAYVAGKKHLWNAGMFFFRAGEMLGLIREHLPELADGLRTIDEAAARGEEESVLAAIFPKLPSISIDHGVMERARQIAVVPGDFGWNDVGSWLSAWELAQKDDRGNALPAGAVAIDASNNLVRDLASDQTGKKKVIALVGVSDLVVVQTDDAILVIPRERAQDVRSVVEALKSQQRTDLV